MAKQKINKEDSKRHFEYYHKNFPGLSIDECKEKAEYFRKSTCSNCIEYWTKKYPNKSLEECEKLLNEHFKNKRAKSKSYKEYWKSKFPDKSIEECEELAKKYKKESSWQCIEYWIKKYPNKSLDECEKLLANKKKEYLAKRPDNSAENNPMHHSKRTEIQIKEGSPMCLEFYKKRYPNLTEEEQIKLWKKSCDKRTQSVRSAIKTTNLEYYLNEGMSKEEAKKVLHDRQATFSLYKCIKKYGEVEGIKRFNERQQKWIKSLNKSFNKNGDGRSPQSKFAKTLIKECCKYFHIQVPKKEKWMYDKYYHKAFAYDFCFKNKIIEFNGDYWHANPKIYDKNFINKTSNLTAQEIWDKDKEKKRCAESAGYKVLYIWEKDYRENPDKELKKCIDFLND